MFYDKFKRLCDEKGVSCNRAALDVGLSDAAPTRWKKNGSTPTVETLSKFADYFNVSMSYLLGDTDDPQDRTKTHWADVVRDDDYDLARAKAAFFRGMDATPEQMDRMWEDAREYAIIKEEQRRRKDGR